MISERLYYRLYAADPGELGYLVERVAAPVVDRVLAGHPGTPWFFLRYLDLTGPQVRLRFRVGAGEAGAVDRTATDALRAAYAADGWPQLRAGATRDGRWFRRFVYEPEYDKYGGPEGVRRAETVFQAGSVAAIRCLRAGLPGLRLGFGAVHLLMVLRVLGVVERDAFLARYERHWSRLGPLDLGPRVAAIAASVSQPLRARLATGPEPVRPIVDYGRWLAGWFGSTGRRDVPVSDADLLFHHTHLMNNRLGVSTVEEAVLARLLRDEQFRNEVTRCANQC